MSLIHACGHLRSLPMYHIYKHYNKKQKKKNKITRLFSIPLLFHFHQLWLMCKNIRNSNYIERKTQFLCYICCFFFYFFFHVVYTIYSLFNVDWNSTCYMMMTDETVVVYKNQTITTTPHMEHRIPHCHRHRQR